mmetsp:Transcript_19601/g.34049  ORF Transcript_19601/g.34049 Transcript_19601/m.34049 type:complete len:209 (-) Transcript_19601:112-738(-)
MRLPTPYILTLLALHWAGMTTWQQQHDYIRKIRTFEFRLKPIQLLYLNMSRLPMNWFLVSLEDVEACLLEVCMVFCLCRGTQKMLHCRLLCVVFSKILSHNFAEVLLASGLQTLAMFVWPLPLRLHGTKTCLHLNSSSKRLFLIKFIKKKSLHLLKVKILLGLLRLVHQTLLAHLWLLTLPSQHKLQTMIPKKSDITFSSPSNISLTG